jgi:hypothetical protein
MPSKLPLRYDATGALIRRGDVVTVQVGDRTMKGVVKSAWQHKRYVEVWLPATPLARHRVVAVPFRRADVSPMPWLARRLKPFVIVERMAA